MIPKKYDAHEYDYPDFQPDQILSADHLNHSFAYNEQQERLTRTNLLGIGIACGLKVSKSADGKTVYISKGTGVTSQGYLIVHGIENSEDSISYKKYRKFDSVQDIKYDVFVTGTTEKYKLYELLDASNGKPEDPDLTSAFLSDKVCLVFFEMLDVAAKNCDTTSCDDKGKTITTTVRKLLVSISDADKIIAACNAKAGASGSGEVFPGIFDLKEIKLPRFDVPATILGTSNEVFEAYQKVFSKNFVEGMGKAFNDAFAVFKTYLKESSNPFANFNTTFAFLHNGTITGNKLLHFQYFYDFFCDLLLAYDEWRQAANALVAMCTPPEALFPRHLLLCNFAEAEGIVKSKYRNYFLPSPILTQHEQAYKEFKSLYQRLDRMIANEFTPVPADSGAGSLDLNIRITPSLLGRFPLGLRAIPFYYKPNEASSKLIDVWNYELSRRGRQTQILSYNPSYNTVDDFVKQPLKYDLEPNNFLRVEGHIGKQITAVLYNLEKLRTDNRLPFQYVALSVDGEEGLIDLKNVACHFEDLMSMYEILKADLLCRFFKLLLCLYQQPKLVRMKAMADTSFVETKERSAAPPENKVAIGLHRDEKLVYNENSMGQVYEDMKPSLGGKRQDALVVIKGYGGMVKNANDQVSYAEVESTNTLLSMVHSVSFLRNGLNNDLSKMNSSEMLDYHLGLKNDLGKVKTAESLAPLASLFEESPCLNDLFDIICDLAQLFALMAEYFKRLEELKKMATLKDFAQKNHGLQHKGGVPLGGTFIVVYKNSAVSTATNKAKEFLYKWNEAQKASVKDTEATAVETINSGTKQKLKSRYVVLTKERGAKAKAQEAKVLELEKKGATKAEIEHELGVVLTEGSLTGKFEADTDKLADGIVLADFYLPYPISCGCSPVQFVVNIPPPKISFSLKDPEYCNEDPKEYLFQANPTAGKLISSQPDAVKENEDGTFSFLPSKVKVNAGDKSVLVNFSYAVEDQMQPISVKVYAMPNEKILQQADALNPLKVQFNLDQPALADKVSWDFGDNLSADTLNPSHTYLHAGEYKVTAKVVNGLCTSVSGPVTVTVKEPDPVVITGLPLEICKTAADINFTVKPTGGIFSGDTSFSVKDAASGKFVFSPSKVNLNGAAKIKVSFNYQAPAGNTDTKDVTVYDTPTGDQNFDNAGGDGTNRAFIFTGFKNTEKIEVDFGDGSGKETFAVSGQTVFKTPQHDFKNGGTYTVKATLMNGTCSLALKPLTVSIDGPVNALQKVCQPLSTPLSKWRLFLPKAEKSPEFKERYPQELFARVSNYFHVLELQLKKDPKVPLSFFVQNPFDEAWIEELPVQDVAAATRALSIEALAIFSNLATTLSCLKQEDIGDGNFTTVQLLKAVINKLESLDKLSAAEKKTIKVMMTDVDDEQAKLKSNQEEKVKKDFNDILKEMRDDLAKLS